MFEILKVKNSFIAPSPAPQEISYSKFSTIFPALFVESSRNCDFSIELVEHMVSAIEKAEIWKKRWLSVKLNYSENFPINIKLYI